ncbi:unnamed protein product [Brassica rapa]|nr:unnamed protein product [Brassica rapa]
MWSASEIEGREWREIKGLEKLREHPTRCLENGSDFGLVANFYLHIPVLATNTNDSMDVRCGEKLSVLMSLPFPSNHMKDLVVLLRQFDVS